VTPCLTFPLLSLRSKVVRKPADCFLTELDIPFPKAYNAWKFCVGADVMSIKIVPGGKYVLVSVREGQNRYALMLLMMEHRVKIAYPVAKIAMVSKAYKLEAKYIRYETEMGIMISYMRREPK
jgi:hypothetical protein